MRAVIEWVRDELPDFIWCAFEAIASTLVFLYCIIFALLCVLAAPATAVALVAAVCWALLKALGVAA